MSRIQSGFAVILEHHLPGARLHPFLGKADPHIQRLVVPLMTKPLTWWRGACGGKRCLQSLETRKKRLRSGVIQELHRSSSKR